MSNTNNKNEAGVNILDLFFYLLSTWPWFVRFGTACILQTGYSDYQGPVEQDIIGRSRPLR